MRLSIVLLALSLHTAVAADLTMMIGDNPPFNSFHKDKAQGMAVDIVDEMLKRAGLTAQYPVYPWARLFNLAQSEANHCAYTVGRLPEREAMFQWIGPIAFNQWAFFALRERNIKLNSLDDARKYTVAGQRKDAKATWLEGRGFQIDYATEERQALLKLMAKRIDLYPVGLFSADDIAKRHQIDPKLLQPVLVFNRVENYLVCSPSTDAKFIAKLQQALVSIKADKTLQKIWDKYEAEFEKPAN